MSCLDELFGDVEYNTQALPDTQAELPDRESEAQSTAAETQMPSSSEALSPIINTQPYGRTCIPETESPAESDSDTSTIANSLSPSTLQHSENVSEAASGEPTQFGTACQHCCQPVTLQQSPPWPVEVSGIPPERVASLKRMNIRIIKELHNLLCRGAITQTEYEQHKDIILNEMLRL